MAAVPLASAEAVQTAPVGVHQTIIEAMPHTYDSVVSDGAADVDKLCLAVRAMIPMLSQFGTILGFVVSDLEKNCTKIEKYRYEHPGDSTATVNRLVDHELAQKSGTASDALVWLSRGLRFLTLALIDVVRTPAKTLTDAFTDAYEKTLYRFHPWGVPMVVRLALKSLFSREELFKLIANQHLDRLPDAPEQLAAWVAPLEAATRCVCLDLFTPERKEALKKYVKTEGAQEQLPAVELPITVQLP